MSMRFCDIVWVIGYLVVSPKQMDCEVFPFDNWQVFFIYSHAFVEKTPEHMHLVESGDTLEEDWSSAVGLNQR